ncbi:MAG: hypothetical protein WB626_00770 [Bacteroidota bacterium]
MMRRLAFLSVLLAGMAPPIVFGGIKVFPTQVFIVSPNRSAPVTLTNTGDTKEEVWVTFRYEYPVGFSSGSVQFSRGDSLNPAEPNAVSWLRSVPQRVVIEAQGSQTVRIVSSPPPGGAGEAWGRVVVSWKRTQPLRVRGAEDRKLLNAVLVQETVIPVHVRRGPVSSGAVIRDFRATPEGKNLMVDLVLDRTGSAALWGALRFELLNERGRSAGSWELPVVVYKQLSYRNSLDIEGVPAGSYTLNLAIDNKHPTLNARMRVSAAPVRQSIRVTIP